MSARVRNELIAIAAIIAVLLIYLCVAWRAAGQDSLNRVGGFSGGFDRGAAIRQYNAPDNFSHRYRVITQHGTNRYCDLSYAFTNTDASSWKFLRGEIAQVHRDGLLLACFHYNADADRIFRDKSVVVKNYPGFSTMKDGDTITCFAIEIGTFQFRDYRGIQRTVPLYDHGIPFDPQALARSNSVANASTNFIGATK